MQPWSKRELLTYLDRVVPVLTQSDHFQLLDVSVNADGATIQGAFHNMAGALHPDRHRNTLPPEDYERLVVVYARIAEAYRVLRDEKHRTKYLREMAQKKEQAEEAVRAAIKGPESALAMLSRKAQHHYNRAMAAKRTGNLKSAELSLRMALAKHPQSGFLREALKSLTTR